MTHGWRVFFPVHVPPAFSQYASFAPVPSPARGWFSRCLVADRA
jgi:hypothetical protein